MLLNPNGSVIPRPSSPSTDSRSWVRMLARSEKISLSRVPVYSGYASMSPRSNASQRILVPPSALRCSACTPSASIASAPMSPPTRIRPQSRRPKRRRSKAPRAHLVLQLKPGWTYDVRTGFRPHDSDGWPIPCFDVELRGNEIWIDLENPNNLRRRRSSRSAPQSPAPPKTPPES